MYVCRVYLCSCVCLHICTPSLQVVYVFTYMQTEFTCVCVYINIYIHGNYMFEGLYLHISTASLQMCLRRVYMYVCMYWHTCAPHPHVCVCMYLCLCTRAYKCMYTCLCLYMCVWVYICIHMCMWKDTWVHTDAMCVHANIHIHGWVCMCVCRCVHLYIYVWKDTVCPRTVCANKYRHTCLCLYLVYGCVLNVCVDIDFYVYTHRGCVCMYTIYMYCICVCTCVRIHTEFSCVIFSMFTYLCYHPVEV